MAPHSPEGQCARGARHKLIRRAPPGFVRRSCGPGWRGPGRHDWGPPGAVATTSPMSTSLPSCASATQEHAGTLAFELDDVRSLRALRAVLDWGKRHISRRSAFEQSSEHSISPPRAAMATKRKQDARRGAGDGPDMAKFVVRLSITGGGGLVGSTTRGEGNHRQRAPDDAARQSRCPTRGIRSAPYPHSDVVNAPEDVRLLHSSPTLLGAGDRNVPNCPSNLRSHAPNGRSRL